MINATPQQLRKAADIAEKIQELQSELEALLGADSEAATETPTKRKFSASTRAKMRKAQQARWATIKGTAPSGPAPKRKMSAQGLANIRAGVAKRMAAQGKAVQKPKRKMSAAVKAKLAEIAKARWARARKEGKTTL